MAVPTESPAMTIENSPRATSAVPALMRARGAKPCRRPASHPVAIFVMIPMTAKIRAGRSTGGMLVGSMRNANSTKKIPANKSLKGSMREEARSCTGPERDSDEEGTHRCRNVELLCDASDHKCEPDDTE